MAWRLAMAAMAVGLVGGLAGARTARAADLEFYTGEALYAQCAAKSGEADAALRQARCAGYVLGVSDARQAAQGAGAPGRVCIPATAGSAQLVGVVTRFLADHPDKRPLAAQDLVIDALGAQFPCR